MSVWPICVSLIVIACVLIGGVKNINRPGRLLWMKATPGTYLIIFGRQSMTIRDPSKAKALAASKKKRKDVPLEVVIIEQPAVKTSLVLTLELCVGCRLS